MTLGASALSEIPLSTDGSGVRVDLFAEAIVLVATLRASAGLRASSSIAVNDDNRIFAASEDYISRASDVVPNRLFEGTLRQALRFNRSLMGGSSFEGFSLGLGEAIMTNGDGAYDRLIGTHALDGRQVLIRLGDAQSAYNSFGIVFAGQSTGYQVNAEEFIVELRDNAYLLDAPASADTFAGTGGVEGGEDLKGRRKPRAFGYCENVTPALLTQNTTLIHCVSSGPVKAIPRAYSRGNLMPLGQDFPTYAALAASTVQKGGYNTCLALGLFRPAFASADEVGQYTADVEGELIDGRLAETTGDIVALLARGAPTVQLDAPSFARLNMRQPAQIGYYLAPGEETTIASLMTTLMRGIGGWAGFRRSGQLEVNVLRAPQPDPSALRVTDIEIISIDREVLPDDISPPPYRMRAAWGRNWTVQTNNVAGAVTEERRAWLRETFRISEPVEDAFVRINHPLAKDPAVLPSFFRHESDAKKEARRQLVLFRTGQSLYRVQMRVAPFQTDIGKSLHITYPRWDLQSGRFFTVVEVDEDTENTIVEALAYG